jgi:hypothetical protein
LIVAELTSQHFRSDPVAGGYQIAGTGSSAVAGGHKEEKSKRDKREPRGEYRQEKRQRPAKMDDGVDEDDEIRKAIELSKISAQREEEERLKELAIQEGKLEKIPAKRSESIKNN